MMSEEQMASLAGLFGTGFHTEWASMMIATRRGRREGIQVRLAFESD
jgi:hypothetical protein